MIRTPFTRGPVFQPVVIRQVPPGTLVPGFLAAFQDVDVKAAVQAGYSVTVVAEQAEKENNYFYIDSCLQ